MNFRWLADSWEERAVNLRHSSLSVWHFLWLLTVQSEHVSDSSAESLHLFAWVFRKCRAITILRLLTRSYRNDGNGRAGAERMKIPATTSHWLEGDAGNLPLSGSFQGLRASRVAHLARSVAGSRRSLARLSVTGSSLVVLSCEADPIMSVYRGGKAWIHQSFGQVAPI
ncbi:uncharacterized protein N7496_009528 [Penicillium cataractarum]|uniref:Uncharacterized protein n=1 Tax=Penicillium cataractarum TaxID=2100454 RepID=A0A9W9RP49_9EURO|nr:uncharacterized protein N7496_009528 [Penicillium cataractarum]KAJ5363815.1 hypothetical protein N7496_009528 [Penicillium cataractarum]